MITRGVPLMLRPHGPGHLHGWWELSYAQYLTIPRSVMQSMPADWQEKMAALLYQLDEDIDWRPKDACYFVTLNRVEEVEDGYSAKGVEIDDPLADYQRGPPANLLEDSRRARRSTPLQRRGGGGHGNGVPWLQRRTGGEKRRSELLDRCRAYDRKFFPDGTDNLPPH